MSAFLFSAFLPGIREPAGRGNCLIKLNAYSNVYLYLGRTCLSPQSQRSLRESQGALLEKVEELTEQLKQERQRALTLEGQLTTSTLSLQTLDKVAHCICSVKSMYDCKVVFVFLNN